jgi:hypothetical protein
MEDYYLGYKINNKNIYKTIYIKILLQVNTT